MEKLNTSDLRKINKRNVFRYVLKKGSITKPEIASALKLSIPTVGMLCDELIQDGLFVVSGTQKSSGGRRAALMEAEKNARYAIGIDITKQHVNFIAVNLAGEIVANRREKKIFSDSKEFYDYAVSQRKLLCSENGIPEEKVLGVGVSVQGLVSKDQKYFASHMIEGKRMVPLRPYEKELPYRFFNDGTACCMSEYYSDYVTDEFVYLMLSRTIGGSIVHNGKIWEGTSLHSGEFGHMILHPDKEDTCYCGGKGHLWCYISVDALEDFCGGTYHDFFKGAAEGDPLYKERLESFINDLSLAIVNLRAVNDCTVVLGGYIRAYLGPYLDDIIDKVARLDHLYTESSSEIVLGQYSIDAAGIGAARYFAEKFIDEIE